MEDLKLKFSKFRNWFNEFDEREKVVAVILAIAACFVIYQVLKSIPFMIASVLLAIVIDLKTTDNKFTKIAIVLAVNTAFNLSALNVLIVSAILILTYGVLEERKAAEV